MNPYKQINADVLKTVLVSLVGEQRAQVIDEAYQVGVKLYDAGHTAGYEAGFGNGETHGFELGFNDGADTEQHRAYNTGYEEGYEDARVDHSWIDWPITTDALVTDEQPDFGPLYSADTEARD